MQQGGSQYGVPPPPEMAPFGVPGGAVTQPQVLGIPGSDQLQQPPVTEVASPISSRQPPVSARQSNFEELVLVSAGNYADDDAFAGGEEVERGQPGNRWPRQETLALLKIRSDMDATFRDATLKGPLWEEVSRKLAEQGYTRSAKKCKEKFENVHKYYKRTKEKCGGRQDGKSYRFFSQLEALHSGSSSSSSAAASALPSPASAAPNIASTSTTTPSPSVFGMTGRIQQPTPLSSIAPPGSAPRPATDPVAMPGLFSAAGGGLSFSSNTSSSSSSSSSESDGEETEEGQRKRKRKSSGGSRKMMSFFQGLMQQVMERQEAMQQKFLETIEKRDQDRMIREEAWRRQEMARITREHEMMAQERVISASRDASIIAFLQKITGQTVQLPQPISITVVPATSTPMPTPPPQQQQLAQPTPTPPPPQQQQQKQKTPSPQPQQQRPETTPAPPSSSELVQFQEQNQELGASGSTDPASSRWPKSEVHALIKLRSGLDLRYQEAGPKGPLWEEISSEMKKLGYNRSAKRCKEKWENINKYFKKVKESNKKRPEDAKTCPYFHQLDALYRKKILGGSGSPNKQENEANPEFPTLPAPPPAAAQSSEPVDKQQNKNADDENNRNGGRNGNGGGGMQATNGVPTSFFEEGAGIAGVSSGGETKKPEGIVRDYDKMEMDQAMDSDNLDDDGDDDEDEEEQKMAYKIEFQRPTANSNNSTNSSVATVAATTAGSFLAMVQ